MDLNRIKMLAGISLNEKSTSEKQARFMAAAAHNPEFAKRAGISQDVAKEFNKADTGTKQLSNAMKKEDVEEPYTDICNQDNPHDAIDACKMEESDPFSDDVWDEEMENLVQQYQDMVFDSFVDPDRAYDKIVNDLRMAGKDEEFIKRFDTALNQAAEGLASTPDDFEAMDSEDKDFDTMTDSGMFDNDEEEIFEEYTLKHQAKELLDAVKSVYTASLKGKDDLENYDRIEDLYHSLSADPSPQMRKIRNMLSEFMNNIEGGNDILHAAHSLKFIIKALQEYNLERTIEEDFDFHNGYDDINHQDLQDYFPTGADSPVVKDMGVNAKSGDNPESKRVKVAEATDIHKGLVYSYRNYLNENSKS